MTEGTYRDEDGDFSLRLAAGWEIEKDEEGGILVWREEGCGVLHLIHFPQDEEEEADPGEELYAFLEDQDIELEEDEVEDVELPRGSLAMCEYITDEEEDSVYWLVAVATAPGQLVFASYSCPSEDEEDEKEPVRRMLTTLRLGGAGEG
jgi:hypothetical protein